MKKISEQEVREYLKKHGGWELISEYINTHTPIVIIRKGYKAQTTFSGFKANDNLIIFGHKNPFYQENIATLIKEKNDKVVFVKAISQQKSGKHRIVVTMIDEKGHEFVKTLEHILGDKHLCCKECSRDKQTEQHRKQYTEKWINRIDGTKYRILTKDDFITAESTIEVEEVDTGYKIEGNVITFIRGKAQAFNVFANSKYFIYNLNVYGKQNGLESTPIKVTNKSASQTKVLFRCSCGKEFERNIYKWMDGSDVCLSCSEKCSKNERSLARYLEEKNIEYIQEYRFNSCYDIKPLPFDFYLPQFKCLIEIDGLQHFKPTNYRGKLDDEAVQKNFALQQRHDKIKNNFCKSNNIPFLRLPYFTFEDGTWIQLFENFINSLRK